MSLNTPSAIPQSSLQGSLFELVARGKKDTYYVADSSSSVFLFGSAYDSSVPFLQERRTTVPLNQPRFGAFCEVELERFGDIITECTILVDLPTWLPPLPTQEPNLNGSTNPIEANSLYWIKDASGVSYGYTQSVVYFLFESIQFYQDSALLMEWSGDQIFALTVTEGSWNSSYLTSQYTGGINVGPTEGRSIAFRATPSRLRLTLPLPGLQTPGDGGFPICCMPKQAYRIRMKLRPLEDIVVSDSLVCKPAPWTQSTFSYTPDGATEPYVFSPLERNQIGQPTILLETRQAYVPHEIKQGLQNNRQSIPFRRPFENIFTFGPNDYTALGSGVGVAEQQPTAAVTRRLDARHPVERIVWFYRTANAIDRNRLWDLVDPSGADGQFYNATKLVIAGRDREELFGPMVWQDMESYAKDEMDSGFNIGEMRWNRGDKYDEVRPYGRVAEGAVNFTSADRPTLYIQLNNVPPQATTGLRKSELYVFMEGWNVFEVAEGRARLKFAN
jgi:hypothetical protein